MSDKALQALDKLIPAPSTKAHQFYLAHYEVIRDEITRLQAENEALRQQLAEVLSAERKFAVNYHHRLREALDDALETLEVVDPRHPTRERIETLLAELDIPENRGHE